VLKKCNIEEMTALKCEVLPQYSEMIYLNRTRACENRYQKWSSFDELEKRRNVTKLVFETWKKWCWSIHQCVALSVLT
jgi:hypothetical protein